jgi:hypothetical protein
MNFFDTHYAAASPYFRKKFTTATPCLRVPFLRGRVPFIRKRLHFVERVIWRKNMLQNNK